MSPKTLLPFLSRIQQEYRVVLASGSPRRKELMATMGLSQFEVIVSNFAENFDISLFPLPQDYCLRTAQQKVENVCRMIGDKSEKYLVIGADTIVTIDGHVLEKPKDDMDAKRMIKMLSGRQHLVHTAVTIFSNGLQGHNCGNIVHAASFVETTKVKFADLSDDDIDAYVATKEGIDKAGSYGIQGYGGQMVKGIEGCYFNVMGFPCHAVSTKLAELFVEQFGNA